MLTFIVSTSVLATPSAEAESFVTATSQLALADTAKGQSIIPPQFTKKRVSNGPQPTLRPNFKGNGTANLPQDLYQNAVTERLEYDPSFNYVERKRISNLYVLSPKHSSAGALVDKVVVYKSHYRMELLKDGKVVRKYWIALSDRPQGDKQYAGDRRTPEGLYTLDYINMKSSYYRSFHISYPNSQDIAEARRMGRSPGGMIMVHGQPPAGKEDSLQRSNWTNGCIAILNHEMDEFIELVNPGTPIEILP